MHLMIGQGQSWGAVRRAGNQQTRIGFQIFCLYFFKVFFHTAFLPWDCVCMLRQVLITPLQN